MAGSLMCVSDVAMDVDFKEALEFCKSRGAPLPVLDSDEKREAFNTMRVVSADNDDDDVLAGEGLDEHEQAVGGPPVRDGQAGVRVGRRHRLQQHERPCVNQSSNQSNVAESLPIAFRGAMAARYPQPALGIIRHCVASTKDHEYDWRFEKCTRPHNAVCLGPPSEPSPARALIGQPSARSTVIGRRRSATSTFNCRAPAAPRFGAFAQRPTEYRTRADTATRTACGRRRRISAT